MTISPKFSYLPQKLIQTITLEIRKILGYFKIESNFLLTFFVYTFYIFV